MTERERLIENAIFEYAKGRSLGEWRDWERRSGSAQNGNNIPDHEFELYWDCAKYVIYKLFDGPEDFKKNYPWGFQYVFDPD